MTDKLIYLAHPVRGDVAANRLRAMLWLKWLTIETGATVIAPWITDVALWDDGDQRQREHGLLKCRTTLIRCDELWMVGGHGASDGMQREAEWALAHGVRVIDASYMRAPWEWDGRTVPPRWNLDGDPMALDIVRELESRKPVVFERKIMAEDVPPEDAPVLGCHAFVTEMELPPIACKVCRCEIQVNHAALWEADGTATCCGCENATQPVITGANRPAATLGEAVERYSASNEHCRCGGVLCRSCNPRLRA